MEIKYFHVTEEDAPAIAEMEEKYFGQPWKAENIIKYLDAGSMIFICAKAGEKLIAYSAVLVTLDEADLVSIAVEKDYRNMGIARELLDISYGLAAEQGVEKLHLEVRESNGPAISLYESEGFLQDGRRKGFYSNPREDALLYIKIL